MGVKWRGIKTEEDSLCASVYGRRIVEGERRGEEGCGEEKRKGDERNGDERRVERRGVAWREVMR